MRPTPLEIEGRPRHVVALAASGIDVDTLAPVARALAATGRARFTWVTAPAGPDAFGRARDRASDVLASWGVPTHDAMETTPRALDADGVLVTTEVPPELPAPWAHAAIASHTRLMQLPVPHEFFGTSPGARDARADEVACERHVLTWSRAESNPRPARAGAQRSRSTAVGCPALDAMTVTGDRTQAHELLGRAVAPHEHLVVWSPSPVIVLDPRNGPQLQIAKTFLAGLPTVVQYVQSRPELVVVLRAHPLLRTLSVQSGEVDALLWVKLDRLVREHPNFLVHTGSDPRPLLQVADALITDPSRELFWFLGTGRPWCLTFDPATTPIDPELDVLEVGARAHAPAHFATFLEDVLSQRDPERAARSHAAEDVLGPLDGRASERAADTILTALDEGLAGGDERSGRALAPIDFFVLQNVTAAGFALYHYLAAHPQLHLPHRDDCDRLLLAGEEAAFAQDPANFPIDPRIEKTGFMVHCGAHLRADMPARIAAIARARSHLVQLVRDPRDVVVAHHRRLVLANVTDRLARELGRPGVVGALAEHPTQEWIATTELCRMHFFAEAQRYLEVFGGEWTIVDALDLWPENVDTSMAALYTRLDVDPAFSSPLFHKNFHGQATKMLHFSQQFVRVNGVDVLVRMELTRDLHHAPGAFRRELARVESVSARLSMPFPDTPVSLATTEGQYRHLTPAMQHLLVRERGLQRLFEDTLLPQWIEHVDRIHHEVMQAWRSEIDPAVERWLHEQLDADLRSLLRHRPDLEDRWGWFASRGRATDSNPARDDRAGDLIGRTTWSCG